MQYPEKWAPERSLFHYFRQYGNNVAMRERWCCGNPLRGSRELGDHMRCRNILGHVNIPACPLIITSHATIDLHPPGTPTPEVAQELDPFLGGVKGKDSMGCSGIHGNGVWDSLALMEKNIGMQRMQTISFFRVPATASR